MATTGMPAEQTTDPAQSLHQQAGTPCAVRTTKARSAQPAVQHRPSSRKVTDRPHPEVPPPRRLHPPPTPDVVDLALPSAHDAVELPHEHVTQRQALEELVRRAGEGNQACLVGLRKILANNSAIWESAGDVSALAQRHWIEALSCGNALVQESIPRRLKRLKADLLGSDPTPLENLLVEVICVSFLAAEHGEIVASRQEGSAQQLTTRLRRAESGQRRLLRAIKTLASVRALLPRSHPAPTKKST